MLKVLALDTSQIWGGAEMYLHGYIGALSNESELEMTVASCSVEKYKELSNIKLLQINVPSLRKGNLFRSYYQLFTSLWLLNRYIRSDKINVLIANSPRAV